MAKNVLDICEANHCLIHNRPCLNKDGAKENHIEITFMMLSVWASEIVGEIYKINFKYIYI